MSNTTVVNIAGLFRKEDAHGIRAASIQAWDYITVSIQHLDIHIYIQCTVGAIAIRCSLDGIDSTAGFINLLQEFRILAKFGILTALTGGIVRINRSTQFRRTN